MFDKKHEKFPNGKVFYMIDRHSFQIRKTKIYGYYFDKKNNFYVLAKMKFFTIGNKNKRGINKGWEFTKPSNFHKALKDAILFAKVQKKNSYEAIIKKHEEEITRRKKMIEEQREKINSITDDSIVVKEGVFDTYCPNTERGYLI